MNYKFLTVEPKHIEMDWVVNQAKVTEYIDGLYHGIVVNGQKWLCGDVGCPNAIIIEEVYNG